MKMISDIPIVTQRLLEQSILEDSASNKAHGGNVDIPAITAEERRNFCTVRRPWRWGELPAAIINGRT